MTLDSELGQEDNFHPPSDYEKEILTILIEECAEVQQRATKSIRFGIFEKQPSQELNNSERLGLEVGDLLHMITLCTDLKMISEEHIQEGIETKQKKLQRYLVNKLGS